MSAYSRLGGLPGFGPLQRWWVGTPSWMKTVPAWLGTHAAEWLTQPQETQPAQSQEGPADRTCRRPCEARTKMFLLCSKRGNAVDDPIGLSFPASRLHA